MTVEDNVVPATATGSISSSSRTRRSNGTRASETDRKTVCISCSRSLRLPRNRFARNGAGVAVMYTREVEMTGTPSTTIAGRQHTGCSSRTSATAGLLATGSARNGRTSDRRWRPCGRVGESLYRQRLGHPADGQQPGESFRGQRLRRQFLRHVHQQQEHCRRGRRQLVGSLPGLRPRSQRPRRRAVPPGAPVLAARANNPPSVVLMRSAFV